MSTLIELRHRRKRESDCSSYESCISHKPGQPTASLVESVCYPDMFCFTTKATEWGCSHEKLAIELYKKTNGVKHQNFTVVENGLFINLEWPFIGALSDSIVEFHVMEKGL